MQKDELVELIKEQIQNQKDFTFDNTNGLIIYTYKGVDYNIEWDKDWESRYGNYVWFRCRFIKNFIINKRTQEIDRISIKSSSIEKDNKNIIKKLKILSKRIREQLEMNEFDNEIKSFCTPKTVKFVGKDLNIPSEDVRTDCTIYYRTDWFNYKCGYPSTIIKRTFNGLSISLRIKVENIDYLYSFHCEYPSKWSFAKIKKIILKNKEETFVGRKQITNIIRYAKLKNIFANG